MKLELENIGIIKKADIEFNGLTVIAGENDSGKSTVGKVLYMLIKSIEKSNSFDIPYFDNYINTISI